MFKTRGNYIYSGKIVNIYIVYEIERNDIDRNVIIFGVDMSSTPYINNTKKDVLILGKGPIQGLEHTLTAEIFYSVNCT